MEKHCEFCHKPFESFRQKRFCSQSCANRFRYKDIPRLYKCKNCKETYEINLVNQNKIFCSQACYFYFKARKMTKSICKTCKCEFAHPVWNHKFIYCSKKCLYSREKSKQYRQKAFQNLPNECSICIRGKGRIEVHHIDCNRLNNEIKNLSIVCHSCHLRIHALIKRSGLNPKKCFEIMTTTDLHKLTPNRFRSLLKQVDSGKFIISTTMDLSYYLR